MSVSNRRAPSTNPWLVVIVCLAVVIAAAMWQRAQTDARVHDEVCEITSDC